MEDRKQGDSASNKENGSPRTTADRECGRWWRRYRPELAKVVSLVEMKLLQVELFLEARESREVGETASRSRKAHELLKEAQRPAPDWCKNLNSAHQLNHELNQVLPLIATDEYLYATLESELTAKEDPEHRVLITDLFDRDAITKLLDRQRLVRTCGCRLFGSRHATCAYSWISPPRRSRRATLSAGTATADSPGPSGGVCPKARCGRWRL